MEKRGQFTFYSSYCNAVKKLPQELQLGMLMAIVEYGLEKRLPQGLVDVQEGYFLLIQPTLDAGWKKAEAGKEGGSKPKAKRKQTQSEKEKEEEIEKEKEIENENETEIEIEDECLSGERDFELFWKRYPIKIDKAGAREAYARIAGERSQIMEGLQRWCDSKQWNCAGGRFIPRAVKWLSEGHYLQEPPQTVIYGATGELGQAEIEAIQRMMEES